MKSNLFGTYVLIMVSSIVSLIIGLHCGISITNKRLKKEAIEEKVGEYFITHENTICFRFKTQEEIVKEYFEIED